MKICFLKLNSANVYFIRVGIEREQLSHASLGSHPLFKSLILNSSLIVFCIKFHFKKHCFKLFIMSTELFATPYILDLT